MIWSIVILDRSPPSALSSPSICIFSTTSPMSTFRSYCTLDKRPPSPTNCVASMDPSIFVFALMDKHPLLFVCMSCIPCMSTPTFSVGLHPSPISNTGVYTCSSLSVVRFNTSKFFTCSSSSFSFVPPISTTSFVIESYASKFDALALRIGLMYNPLCLISRILFSEALNTMEFLGCSESMYRPRRTISVG